MTNELARLREAGMQGVPPRLWEALRLEMQRRYRLATGEERAVIRIEFDEDP